MEIGVVQKGVVQKGNVQKGSCVNMIAPLWYYTIVEGGKKSCIRETLTLSTLTLSTNVGAIRNTSLFLRDDPQVYSGTRLEYVKLLFKNIYFR